METAALELPDISTVSAPSSAPFLILVLIIEYSLPSSRLFLAVQTLGAAIGFVGNYSPWDFRPRFGTCPSH